jgi:hypothetical protein
LIKIKGVNKIMTLEESDALREVHRIAELYGWRIPMIWTPALVKHMFQTRYSREMTDEEWEIFARSENWDSGVIMAGGGAEAKVIMEGLANAVESAENAAGFEEIKNIYFPRRETGMGEILSDFYDN